jgi:hypothetical protein
MRVHGLVLSVIAAAVGFGLAVASAQTVQITFLVPIDTPVLGGTGDDVAIFTGRPLGVIGAGACQGTPEGSDGFPLQNMVVVHPRTGADTITVIVLATDPVRAGTRLENLQIVESCTGPDGSEYNKHRGDVQ